MTKLYTAEVNAIAGREGSAASTDKALSVKLAKPGSTAGTNPEQLFAAAYAACFGGAVGAVAKQHGKDASNVEIKADVTLNKDDSGFFISAILNVSLPNIDKNEAQQIVQEADVMCPYSKAIRGNVDVQIKVNNTAINKVAA